MTDHLLVSVEVPEEERPRSVVHMRLGSWTMCGLQALKKVPIALEWSKVTCSKCLKRHHDH